MYSVHDWADVHRLHREGLSQARIARRLGMSRNTVSRLLGLTEPPTYRRPAAASLLDAFKDAVAAMLDEDPGVRSTVVLERLRREGYAGGRTILKDHLREVRPHFAAARAYQRTTYLPGEVGQADWWHTGWQVPVGKGANREAFGLVTALPHSAAHAVVYTFSRTTADLLPALLGCFSRLGGVPEVLVIDNDPSAVASGKGRRARVHDEVAEGTLRRGSPEEKLPDAATMALMSLAMLIIGIVTGLAAIAAGVFTYPGRRPQLRVRVGDLRQDPDLTGSEANPRFTIQVVNEGKGDARNCGRKGGPGGLSRFLVSGSGRPLAGAVSFSARTALGRPSGGRPILPMS